MLRSVFENPFISYHDVQIAQSFHLSQHARRTVPASPLSPRVDSVCAALSVEIVSKHTVVTVAETIHQNKSSSYRSYDTYSVDVEPNFMVL